MPRQIPWIATGSSTEDLPQWVDSFIERGATHASRSISLLGVGAEELAESAKHAFIDCIDSLPGPPCRVWAFLPRPTEVEADFLDRYMRFNIGRTNAYRSRPERISIVPAGTCVGHGGTNLCVHALHQPGPMTAVENPRQRAAWLYSKKYGPVSPAFTRGVLTNGVLLASGTAAIVGETTLHESDFPAQFAETLCNLQSLAIAGGTSQPWRSVQIYVRDEHNLEQAEQLAHNAFGSGFERVLCAPLCRSELLVEIEGVANID